ncbi:hypothetical protein KVU_0414 [Ketogulonicigenium vulgare WSH-001]|uniref:Uncharacterized protein n=1 Tax=Ketogulonicigenium vulgare (strain WSH-001) TaxID=759362 RepID=F9YA80_KETVW|nr:hypothetical protein KVU_0414 [Ketogulonicigenium vulgare WSH-001]
MGVGQIDDMDVIAHASAIGRVIIIAKHRQLFTAARGHLCQERHQIVRNADRVLANRATRVGADGVEIAQEDRSAPRRRLGPGRQQLFGREFGLAVDIGRGQRVVFGHRQELRLAINRGRGGEHDLIAARRLHRADQRQRAGHVHIIIIDGARAAFAHGLQPGKVDDRIGTERNRHSRQRSRVANIDIMRLDMAVGDRAHAVQRDGRAVRIAVDNAGLIAHRRQFDQCMAADITGPACHKNAHKISPENRLCRCSNDTM